METPFDIAADLETPVSAFLKLLPFRPRFLLESVEGGERIGRFSFLGFGKARELRIEADALRFGDLREPLPRGRTALLDALRRALEQTPALKPALRGVPFTGGLVGVAGYSLASRLEERPVARHAPGLPEAAYLATDSLLVFDHLTRRVALLHSGGEAERRSLHREIESVLRGPLPPRPRAGRFSPPRPGMDAPQFSAGVAKVLGHITAGDIYQMVLSVRFSGESDIPPFEAYRALRLLNPSPYMYFCDFGDFSLAGSSPEALARLAGREATLRPIAGTRPRDEDPERDRALEQELLSDPKERAEHVMLVDLARNDLGRVALTGTVEVGPYRAVERYSHVMHLVSGVRGVLPAERDAFDLFAAAFPAGTVAGAPKIRAMELIDAMEPEPRGLYAGTVGYFGRLGSMDQAIAIRTLLFRNGSYVYQAGAGIVAESRPDREFAEVMAKGAALEAALALSARGL
jgi:anthranilate synthase component I